MAHAPANIPAERTSIIKAIGVGGGGSNAVNYMHRLGIKGVDFVVCNTDKQALDYSPVDNKLQLGINLTRGLGAGNNPDIGKNSALESREEIRKLLSDSTSMVFITAGMGGGTGTGAAPVIAGIAKEMGILTVGIVTTPFGFEGPARRQQAQRGVNDIKQCVDTLLVICNEKIRAMYGDMDIDAACEQADTVLATAVKGIAEIITVPGKINVDFEDVRTVMTDGGVAIMGSADAEGEDRARVAIEKALSSPLLNDNKINGAKHLLLNITYGNKKVTMDEVTEITEYVQTESGKMTNLIWGHAFDDTLCDRLNVTIIATGYPSHTDSLFYEMAQMEKKVKHLENPHMVVNRNTGTGMQEENKKIQEPVNTVNIGSGKRPLSKPVSFTVKKKETKESAHAEQASLNFSLESPPPQNVPAYPHDATGADKTKRLKDLSYRRKSTSGMTDLERVPAYIRRNIKLDQPPHSSETEVSRFTLSVNEDETGKKTPEIKPGNSFLHDNVD